MITVQPNINVDSPWNKSFLEIKETWEKYALKNELDYSGTLNTFGVWITIQQRIGIFDCELKIRKQQENTRGSAYSLKANSFASIITIEGNAVRVIPVSMVIGRNNFLFKLLSVFNSLPYKLDVNGYRAMSNNLEMAKKALKLTEHNGFYHFKMSKSKVSVKLTRQMENIGAIERFIFNLEGITGTKSLMI